MDTLGIFYAIATVLAWGTWLVPAQKVKFANEQVKIFYVAVATCLVAQPAEVDLQVVDAAPPRQRPQPAKRSGKGRPLAAQRALTLDDGLAFQAVPDDPHRSHRARLLRRVPGGIVALRRPYLPPPRGGRVDPP